MKRYFEKLFRHKYVAGFSAVEALLATALFALIAVAISGSLIYGQQSGTLAHDRIQAALLADEGLEAVRSISDDSFTNLTDGTYGLQISGNQWVFSGSSDSSGVFTRQVTIATVDASRKNITSTVTWQETPQRTGTVAMETRFTAWAE